MRGKSSLALSFVLAGTSVVTAGFLRENLGPFTTTLLSLCFAVPFGLLLDPRGFFGGLRRLDTRQGLALLAQALFGMFLYRALLNLGLGYTGTVQAGLLTGTSPAITALLSRLLLGERVTRRKALAVGLTVAGIFLLQGGGPEAAGLDWSRLLGNLLVLGAAASESVFNVLSRRLLSRDALPLTPAAQSTAVSLTALVLCLGPALGEGALSAAAALPPSGWLALAWYGVVITILAYICFFTGARTCDGYTIGAYSGLVPMTSLALSAVLLGEAITAPSLAGGACIVAAVLLMGE